MSVFRISFSRPRHPSIPNRSDRRRTPHSSFSNVPSFKPRPVWWRKLVTLVCPCLIHRERTARAAQEAHHFASNDPLHETSPGIQMQLTPDEEAAGVRAPLLMQTRASRGTIDNEGMTCDTLIVRHGIDDELLSDENDVTFHRTSTGEHASSISNHTPILSRKSLADDEHQQSESASALVDAAPGRLGDDASLR